MCRVRLSIGANCLLSCFWWHGDLHSPCPGTAGTSEPLELETALEWPQGPAVPPPPGKEGQAATSGASGGGVAAPSPVSLLTLAPLRSPPGQSQPASYSSDQRVVHNSLCLSLNSLLSLSLSHTLLAEGC